MIRRLLALRFLLCHFLLLPLALPSSALAHEIKPSIATLKILEDRSFELKIETNLEALLAQIGAEHEDTDDSPSAALYNQLRSTSSDDLKKQFQTFSSEFLPQIGLSSNDEAVELKLKDVFIPEVGDIDLPRESIVNVTGVFSESVEKFGWAYPEKYGDSVLRIERPGQELQAQFFAAGSKKDDFDVGLASDQTWWQVAWTYLVSGFDHIVPQGLDHILFVLGLFFLSPRLKPLLWQVSAFTLAHTVTLALGLYGIINISPSIVEPLIALSIVYVAVENIVTKELHPWRPAIVFAFGLLHGLGFAGVLAEFGLPTGQVPLALISFNIGVEFGQLFVIAVAAILVGWAFKREWYRSAIAIPASVLIGLMGAYWFVERTLL